MSMRTIGIILTAGDEVRFSGNMPKTLYLYNGMSMLDHNIKAMKNVCDEVYVVASNKNEKFFVGYNTITIESGSGCGDATLKALLALHVLEGDTCVLSWGDCLCQKVDEVFSFFNQSNCDIVVPCVTEEEPYVSLSVGVDSIITSVAFSKYGEPHKSKLHDLGFFVFDAKKVESALMDFKNRITIDGAYRHKHGDEMNFLDILNETLVRGCALLLQNIKSISFNTIEEFNKL